MVLDTECAHGEQYSPSTVNRPVTRIALALAISFVAACTTTSVPPPTPKTPTWDTFGELAHPRSYATAVVLQDGEILVVGGLDRDDPNVTNAESELVNVKTGEVTVLKHQLVGRLHQTMTRVKMAKATGEGAVRTDVPAVVLPYKRSAAKPAMKRRAIDRGGTARVAAAR